MPCGGQGFVREERMKESATRKVFLVIDMLNDFILEDAPLQVPSGRGMVPALRKRLEEARSGGIPLLYLCDAHDPDDAEFELWPRHAIVGTHGAEVIDELKPVPGDYVIPKKRFSGFFRTELDRILRKLAAEHLWIAGLVTNICVLYTVADARSRGYRVTVFQDSVAGLNPEDHDFALRQMREILGAEVA